MSVPPEIYTPSLALMTDLYELTMAYSYWKTGMTGHEATFVLSFRKPPFNGPYAIAVGLAYVVDYLSHFNFKDADLSYLKRKTPSRHLPMPSQATAFAWWTLMTPWSVFGTPPWWPDKCTPENNG